MREDSIPTTGMRKDLERWDSENMGANDIVNDRLSDVTELLNDALPDGYYVKLDQ